MQLRALAFNLTQSIKHCNICTPEELPVSDFVCAVVLPFHRLKSAVADPGNRKGGFQTIEREARKIWGYAHFRCNKTRENPILSQGKSHLRLRGTAANSQASLG